MVVHVRHARAVRAVTFFAARFTDVDGRDKPGHDKYNIGIFRVSRALRARPE
jgi:hypothetical protein